MLYVYKISGINTELKERWEKIFDGDLVFFKTRKGDYTTNIPSTRFRSFSVKMGDY